MHKLGYLVGCLIAAVSALAQQGHPLTGTWNGDWGTSPDQRIQLTIVMDWDGKAVNAVINPGPGSAPGTVTVDVVNWTVRIAADLKNSSGKPVHLVADGRLEDLGSYHRTLSGAWHQGSATGTFKLTRE